MASQWWRRAGLLAAACAAGLLLAACGGGSIESQISPKRLVAFGDGLGDVGQNGKRFTVNDGGQNNWTEFVAGRFVLPLTAASAGGQSYATGNARVQAKPDAGGASTTRTVREQVDAFLAGAGPAQDDLVLVSAGTSDLVVELQRTIAGSQTRDQMLVNVGQAGRDLGAEVRRLVQAGARNVVVVGPYNLGRSIWATQTRQTTLMQEASTRFNDQLLVSIVDLGANVLYVDAALYFNLITASPEAYGFNNVTVPACNSVDPGAGIGTGANEVNSNLCTTTTLVDANYEVDMFADRVYPSPHAHRLFGEYAFNRIRERW